MGAAVQIAQPGFDIRTCPDWAYLFNSDWPSLAITFEQTVPTPLPVKIAHNLGYPPLVLGWNNFGTYSYGRCDNSFFQVDSTYIYFNATTSATSITVRCYNIDVSKESSYPLPQSAAAKLPYNNQFGIKVLKPNGPRSIQSTNLNDFVIHSRGQSQAVLQVATQAGKYFTNTNPGSRLGGPWIVYPLQTPYVPWVICIRQVAAGVWQAWGMNTIEIINNQIVMALYTYPGSVQIGSIIVLRDPLFYPNVLSVVY